MKLKKEEKYIRNKLDGLGNIDNNFLKKEIKENLEKNVNYSKFSKRKFLENKNKRIDEKFHKINNLNNNKLDEKNRSNLNNNKLDEIRLSPSNFSDKGPNKIEVHNVSRLIKDFKKEISKAVIGQEKIIDAMIRGIICDGHILLEGIPGIAKTLIVRAIGKSSGCEVNRVQFTVDLLPTDIIGITSYTPKKGFETIKGPIFTNYLIADEINRSPPKTQSALIEAMQEKQVTIGRDRHQLPSPFFVMATRNPIENLGVYPLPEAQIDRFLFNIKIDYPNEEDEIKILEHNITIMSFDDFKLKSVIQSKDILKMQKIVREIYVSDKIKFYISSIIKKTRDKNSSFGEYISYGASPRGSIGLFIASKARALMEGRNYVLPEDIREVIYDVLRHRLILSYKATLKKVSQEDIIKSILNELSVV